MKNTVMFEVVQREDGEEGYNFLCAFVDFEEAYMFAYDRPRSIIVKVETTRENITIERV